jgi:hypothetical protein
LLQSRPEAGRKVLSDNSLLKNIEFNETFLGEELITESMKIHNRNWSQCHMTTISWLSSINASSIRLGLDNRFWQLVIAMVENSV